MWPTTRSGSAHAFAPRASTPGFDALDELHLSISPFVAGAGESLLSGIGTTAMDLTGVTEIGNSAVVLTNTPVRYPGIADGVIDQAVLA